MRDQKDYKKSYYKIQFLRGGVALAFLIGIQILLSNNITVGTPILLFLIFLYMAFIIISFKYVLRIQVGLLRQYKYKKMAEFWEKKFGFILVGILLLIILLSVLAFFVPDNLFNPSPGEKLQSIGILLLAAMFFLGLSIVLGRFSENKWGSIIGWLSFWTMAATTLVFVVIVRSIIINILN